MLKRLLLVFPLLLLCACASSSINEMSQALDLALPEGDIITDIDTHGGFHGDGISCLVLSVSPENGAALADKLAERADWHQLPLDAQSSNVLSSCLSLLESEGFTYSSPVQGWYWYLDRSPVGHTQDFPANCTLAIYDVQNCQLVYFCLDT